MDQGPKTYSEFVEDLPADDAADSKAGLLVRLDGYEGPMHMLLDLARSQKVDLIQISVLQLARQYLAFIEQAKRVNLQLAAEYLVMAAWLTYLKSRLLLPKEEQPADEHSAEDMAEALQFQLRRLEAMRACAVQLSKQPQLGRDIFVRGAPEGLSVNEYAVWDVSLVDLLRSYGRIKRRKEKPSYDLPTFTLLSMDRAMERLERMLGQLPRSGPGSVWATLDSFMPEKSENVLYQRSSLASTLTAMLELAKQGKVEVRQDGLFRPVYMRGLAAEPQEIAS